MYSSKNSIQKVQIFYIPLDKSIFQRPSKFSTRDNSDYFYPTWPHVSSEDEGIWSINKSTAREKSYSGEVFHKNLRNRVET